MTTKNPIISIVAGVALNNVIGLRGDMPWKVSADLRNFKAITMNKPIIMGRKTFESIGRALPGRRNLVVTRNKAWSSDGVETFSSLEKAIRAASEAPEIMVIGGGELYKLALPIANRLYISQIHTSPEGDTWFPSIDEGSWRIVKKEPLRRREGDTAEAIFVVYERI